MVRAAAVDGPLAWRRSSRLGAGRFRAVALHGDIHHENVLDFGPRGWLVIDPKGLLGERGYDYANLFCNPDEGTATTPGRLGRQLEIVAAAANLDRRRLLQRIVAWAGLSAMWTLELELSPRGNLRVAEIAASALRG
jgi:streptomycin 6-kinase